MLELTNEEKQIIVNALDLVVRNEKVGGLNAAQAALPIALKIQKSMEASEKSE